MQQQLGAADESLAAYVWWPSDNEAGVASLQALYESGVPVIQTNQLPFPGSEQYIVGYAGVNDSFNGEVAAGLVVEARDWMVDHGATLHSDGGNAIIVGFPAGYQAGIDRSGGGNPDPRRCRHHGARARSRSGSIRRRAMTAPSN